MNTKQPRDAWIHCERGHLFYSASSNTQCHVCKAHRLPPLSKTPKVTTLDKLMLKYHQEIAGLAPGYRAVFLDKLAECAGLIDAQNKIGGWVRLPVGSWIQSEWHRTRYFSSNIRNFLGPEAWLDILLGKHYREIDRTGYRLTGYFKPVYANEGEFDHERDAAAEEEYILSASRAHIGKLERQWQRDEWRNPYAPPKDLYDFINWQRKDIEKRYPLTASYPTYYRFQGMASQPTVAEFVATGIALLWHLGEPVPIDLFERVTIYEGKLLSWVNKPEDIVATMTRELRKVTHRDFTTFSWISRQRRENARKLSEKLQEEWLAECEAVFAGMGSAAEPARATQPLHDAHCQARRKWRKALADMLREERACREGQTAFRAAVLANYGGRCAITGTAIDVEAAHIEPWRENGNQEPDNGIPMAWALHKCYDRTPAMFAIHPDTLRIHVRPDVVGLEGYNGVQIADGQHTPINREKLRDRWRNFLA